MQVFRMLLLKFRQRMSEIRSWKTDKKQTWTLCEINHLACIQKKSFFKSIINQSFLYFSMLEIDFLKKPWGFKVFSLLLNSKVFFSQINSSIPQKKSSTAWFDLFTLNPKIQRPKQETISSQCLWGLNPFLWLL